MTRSEKRFNKLFHRAVQKIYGDEGFWELWSRKPKPGLRTRKEAWVEEVTKTIDSLDQVSKQTMIKLLDLYMVDTMKDINYEDRLDTVTNRARLIEQLRLKQDIKASYRRQQKIEEKPAKHAKLRGISRKR